VATRAPGVSRRTSAECDKRGSQLVCDDRPPGWPGDQSISCSPARPKSPKTHVCRRPVQMRSEVPTMGALSLSLFLSLPPRRPGAGQQADHRLGILSDKRFLGWGEPHNAQVPHSPPFETAWPLPAFLDLVRGPCPVSRGPRRSVRPSW
jgi:hypothetical protein